MKVLKIHHLNGPNYWSNRRKKLIVMTLDLEKYEYLPTNKLHNFSEALQSLMPTLYAHRCSPGIKGGFYLRLKEGTWLGHVIEHVALELQYLAGMNCGFGRTYTMDVEGVYQVIFAYQIEEAGFYAAKAAINIVCALAENQQYPNLEEDLNALKALFHAKKLGPSTHAIVDEAQRRNIPCSINDHLITLGYGCRQKKNVGDRIFLYQRYKRRYCG